MGRTVPTMTQIVAQEEANFAPFRRALRKEDRTIFDRLFAAARHHTAPAAYLSRPVPFEVILVAMLLEMAKQVDALRARVEVLEGSRAPGVPGRADGTAE
ncbi:MAG: hypothetical protein QN168_00450 [Armatimonadota bacterium]|nr:hypothetical protein [Armatimonadota bacterium]